MTRRANDLGHTIAALEPEIAAYEIGRIYMALLPDDFRARHGVYYTPPALTKHLTDRATSYGVDWSTCTVLDPACGGGAFLAPAARRMLDAAKSLKPAAVLATIGSRLYGYEIDPLSGWLAQVSIDAMLFPFGVRADRPLPLVVKICDALGEIEALPEVDLVIGNPPYGRISLSPAHRQRFARSLYGHANLYGVFTDLALRRVKPSGMVAYVTPTSFLSGEYFKNLRRVLGVDAAPVTIDFVTARKGVFDDVLQEILLATYRRGASVQPIRIAAVTPTPDGEIETADLGSSLPPEDTAQPWILPRSEAQAVLVERLNSMPHRLRDWGYEVSTGPLVWNRHKKQLRFANGGAELPLIWAEAITADGRFVYRAEKRNHAPYFLPQKGDDWLVTDTPCVLMQRTTAKEQRRRLIAAALPRDFLVRHKGVVIENHVNMVKPVAAAPAVPPETVAAFFNSLAADHAFRCLSGSVAVSAYELEALPLPAPAAMAAVTNLIRGRADRKRIDAACARLYTRPLKNAG
jgi:adenine-specific DNA-methyltransferase